MSDFTIAYTENWGDGSLFSVFAASLNKRFLIDSNYDLGFQVIDLVGENIGSYVECVDNLDISHGSLLKLYPDGSHIIAGSGNIFDTDDNMHLSGSLGYSFDGLVYYDDKILLLTRVCCPINLIALSRDTHQILSNLAEFEDVKGRNLFVSDSYLYIVTEDWENSTYITRFDLSDL